MCQWREKGSSDDVGMKLFSFGNRGTGIWEWTMMVWPTIFFAILIYGIDWLSIALDRKVQVLKLWFSNPVLYTLPPSFHSVSISNSLLCFSIFLSSGGFIFVNRTWFGYLLDSLSSSATSAGSQLRAKIGQQNWLVNNPISIAELASMAKRNEFFFILQWA